MSLSLREGNPWVTDGFPLHYGDVIMGSNHQPYDCLLDRLFRRRWKKTSRLRVTGLCAQISPVHKWPVTRKMFPFDDIIMTKGQWSGKHPCHAIIKSCFVHYVGICFMVQTINNSVYSEDVFIYLARGSSAWYYISIATAIEIISTCDEPGFCFEKIFKRISDI